MELSLACCSMDSTMMLIGDNCQTNNFDHGLKPGDSSIKEEKASANRDSDEENDRNGKCEHFSIRGFVSEARRKDWKICWPFSTDGVGIQCDDPPYVLPPLEVPKFKFWRCESCLDEMDSECKQNNAEFGSKFKTSDMNHPSKFSDALSILSYYQQAQKSGISTGKRINAKLSGKDHLTSEWHLLCTNAKEKPSNAVCFRQEDAVMDATINPKQKTSMRDDKVADPKSHGTPNLIQSRNRLLEDVDTSGSGKGDETQTAIEARASDRHQVGEGGDDLPFREAKVLREPATSGKSVMESNPFKLLEIAEDRSAASMEIVRRKEDEELSNEGSIGLPSRKRARKVRLLTELLCGKSVKADPCLKNQESEANVATDLYSVDDKILIQAQSSHGKRGLVHCKKRKPPDDEEWKPVGKSVLNRVRQNGRKGKKDGGVAEDLENATVIDVCGQEIAIAEDLENAFAKMSLFGEYDKLTGDIHDGTPSMSTDKKQKAWFFGAELPSLLVRENDAKDTENHDRDSFQERNVFSEVVNEVVKTKEMDLFPLSAPMLESEHGSSKTNRNYVEISDLQAFNICSNDKMIKESSVPGKCGDNAWNESLNHQVLATDATLDEALNLSLNSYMTAQNCQQLAERRSFSVTSQTCTSNVSVFRDSPELRCVKSLGNCSNVTPSALSPGRDSLLGAKRPPPYGTPFIDESQNYSSLFQLGNSNLPHEILHDGNSQKKYAGILDSAILTKGAIPFTKNKGSEHSGGDFPIEIAELMAQNQYERRLTDSEYHKPLIEFPSTARKSSMIDFSRAHTQREVCFQNSDDFHKYNYQTKSGRTGGIAEPIVHSPVGFFPLTDLNRAKGNHQGQVHSPVGFRPFSKYSQKPSSGFQNSVSSSAKPFHPRKWTGDAPGKASAIDYSISSSSNFAWENPYQQNKDSEQIWQSSISANQMPVIYGFPQACSSTNFQPRLSELQGKNRQNDKCDLVFLNQTEVNHGKQSKSLVSAASNGNRVNNSFSYKVEGVEGHKKPKVSLDLYSNDTIPAMHLLSLMDAGASTSAPRSVDRRRRALKRAPNNYARPASTSNRTSSSSKLLVNGNRQRPEPPVSTSDFPKSFGVSIPPFLPDRSSKRVAPEARVEDKGKSLELCMENNVSNFQGSASPSCLHGSNPVFCTQEIFSAASDLVELPFQSHRIGKMKNKVDICVPVIPAKQQQRTSKTEICAINRNPADFSIPDAKSLYMISGEELKFEKLIPISKDTRLPKPRKRRPKLLVTGKEKQQSIAT